MSCHPICLHLEEMMVICTSGTYRLLLPCHIILHSEWEFLCPSVWSHCCSLFFHLASRLSCLISLWHHLQGGVQGELSYVSWNRKVHNILASTSFSGTSGEMRMLFFFHFSLWRFLFSSFSAPESSSCGCTASYCIVEKLCDGGMGFCVGCNSCLGLATPKACHQVPRNYCMAHVLWSWK